MDIPFTSANIVFELKPAADRRMIKPYSHSRHKKMRTEEGRIVYFAEAEYVNETITRIHGGEAVPVAVRSCLEVFARTSLRTFNLERVVSGIACWLK